MSWATKVLEREKDAIEASIYQIAEQIKTVETKLKELNDLLTSSHVRLADVNKHLEPSQSTQQSSLEP